MIDRIEQLEIAISQALEQLEMGEYNDGTHPVVGRAMDILYAVWNPHDDDDDDDDSAI